MKLKKFNYSEKEEVVKIISFKKKNKNGQVGFIALMLAIILIILTMALLKPNNEIITGDDVMGENGLNCSNPNITNQNKAICTQTDSFQFLWFAIGLGFAGILLWRVVL